MDKTILTSSFVEGKYSPEQLEKLAHLGTVLPGWFGWERGQKRPMRKDGLGSVNDAATEMTLEQALATMAQRKWGGVGVSMLTAAPGLVGMDLDHVIDKAGRLSDLGREAVERFAGAYVEVSPSGTGLRIFAWGVLPVRTPKGSIAVGGGQKVEMYPAGAHRFLRVTGAVVDGTAGGVLPCQAGIDWLAGIATKAKVGAGQGSPDNAKATAHDQALSLDAVFEELEALRPERDASAVIVSLKSYAAGKPRSKAAEALRGNKAPWADDWSSADQFLCCEAIRRGAGSLADVCEVWKASPLAQRDKFKRKDYRAGTVGAAARAVLPDLRNQAARGGSAAALAAPVTLPEGLSEALALSGDTLTRGSNGRILAQVGNVVVLFRNAPELRPLVGFNELAQAAHRLQSWQVLARLAASEAGPVTDDDVTRAGMYLERAYNVKVDSKELMRALEASARDASFDPLADALLALVWDGLPRVGTWLVDWMKVDTSNGKGAYIKAVGQCFLVGAVARALSPGCQMDTVLSVEGSGGGGKSTAFRVLADAISPNLFADGVHDVSSTAALVEGTGGRWIVEIAELAGVRKAADVEALKAALTRQRDTHRRPYDVLPREVPRRFVFVATTNRSEYLSDPSGALLRRFWPAHTLATEQDPIDRAGLAGVAKQLWAEAVHLFKSGVKWHIGPEDGEAYTGWGVQRDLRREEGPFHDEVVEFLAAQSVEAVGQGWRLKEIARELGDLKAADGDPAAISRLSGTLRALGLKRYKVGGASRWHLEPNDAVRHYTARHAATVRK